MHVAEGVDADEALRIAGAVASAGRAAGGATGSHPIGAVVADAARDRFGELPGVAEFDGYPALGVRGIVTELHIGSDDEPRVLAHAALVGRVALLTAHGIALPDELAAAVTTVHAAGATAVAVSWDGVARAVLEVTDPLRTGAPEAAHALRELGLSTVLLTGDDAGAARGLADVLGVDEVLADVATADRGTAVARLRAAGRTVAVVGGPADEVALARGRRRTGPARRIGRRPDRPFRRWARGRRRAGRRSPDRRRRPPHGPRDGADGRTHAHRRRGVPPGRAAGGGRGPAAAARGGRRRRGLPRRRSPARHRPAPGPRAASPGGH